MADILRERRWFSREELSHEIGSRLKPEFCARVHLLHGLQQKSKRHAVETYGGTIADRVTYGACLLISLFMYEWEKRGWVERVWDGKPGVSSRNGNSWKCRATPIGINYWESKAWMKYQQPELNAEHSR